MSRAGQQIDLASEESANRPFEVCTFAIPSPDPQYGGPTPRLFGLDASESAVLWYVYECGPTVWWL